MPEPLSIATGVASLLKVTWTVGVELKAFRDGVKVVSAKLDGLVKDVEGLKSVLESMQVTFESITAVHGTGHIGSHWQNIAQALEDGGELVGQLRDELAKVNKTTTFLDGPRKQLRLNMATETIAAHRVSIQSYRDALGLSLQTVILWNQVSQNEVSEQVLPTLSELQADVRRIALEMNERIATLQATIKSEQDVRQEAAFGRLRECVKSAASVVSSASTILAPEKGDAADVLSDFGDCFPEQSEMLSRWVQSAALQEEYDDKATLRPPESEADLVMIGDSGGESEDSDVDLESEITMLIYENAKKKSTSGDRSAAERMMQKCLLRLTGAGGRERSIRHIDGQPLEVHVLTSLYVLYTEDSRWPDAQRILVKRMQLQERLMPQYPSLLISDTLDLAQLLFKQDKYAESELHARRALKGFRKHADVRSAAKCVDLIIKICEKEGRDDDAEAYTDLKVRILGIDLKDDSNAASQGADDSLSNAMEPIVTTTSGVPSGSIKVSADGGLSSPPLVADPKSSTQAVQQNEQVTSDARTETTAKPEQPIVEASALRGPAGSEDHVPLRERVATSDIGSIEGEANRAEVVQPYALKERMPQAPQLVPRDDLKPRRPVVSTPLKSILKPKQEAPVRDSNVDLAETGLQGQSKVSEAVSIPPEGFNVRALYDYSPEKDDKEALAFVAGDIIWVISQLDSGWWDGVLNGVRGWFPSNYTDILDSHQYIASRQYGLYDHIPQKEDFSRRYEVVPGDGVHIGGNTFVTIDDIHAIDAARSENSASTRIPSNKHAEDKGRQNVDALHGTSSVLEIGKHKKNKSVSSRTGMTVDWPMPRPSDRPTLHYRRKVVVVGDSGVGKTTLLTRLINDNRAVDESTVARRSGFAGPLSFDGSEASGIIEIFSSDEDVYRANIETEGRTVELTLIETSGFEEYDALRQLPYSGAHAVLICFSINSQQSYGNVLGKWASEVSKNCPSIPTILVGLQADLRTTQNRDDEWRPTDEQITTKHAIELQKQLGAVEYIECSALSRNVQEVFVAVARYAIFATAARKSFHPPSSPQLRPRGSATARDPSPAKAKAIELPEIRRKLVAVGDGAIGKTALLLTFSKGFFDFTIYGPGTIFDNYVADVEVDGKRVELALWDTAGVEDYDRLREVSYPDAHVILICFSIDRPASYENITEKVCDPLVRLSYATKHKTDNLQWIHEVRRFCARLPIVLVGLQKDLRYDPQILAELAKTNEFPVTPQQGEDLRKTIGAIKYLECSSKTKEGVREVFEYATRSALLVNHKQKRSGFRALFKKS
ncbi:GTP-binding protein Rho1 [Elasticomyces elasticus]|nr:GTP-binding protein Rho1 [Elasticomyces elasticus]KAK3656680.1 GTP-binding protein Rho1 [Elasticomyces elasticus]KAK4921552.1 GTP-binding protein Rho1 [Elasticomyces elasticus]KAK5760240.1 GTP-binding protein Rho1 [Elasticomyces elasticus]